MRARVCESERYRVLFTKTLLIGAFHSSKPRRLPSSQLPHPSTTQTTAHRHRHRQIFRQHHLLKSHSLFPCSQSFPSPFLPQSNPSPVRFFPQFVPSSVLPQSFASSVLSFSSTSPVSSFPSISPVLSFPGPFLSRVLPQSFPSFPSPSFPSLVLPSSVLSFLSPFLPRSFTSHPR